MEGGREGEGKGMKRKKTGNTRKNKRKIMRLLRQLEAREKCFKKGEVNSVRHHCYIK